MAANGASTRPTKRRKISSVESPADQIMSTPCIVRVTRNTSTPVVNKNSLSQPKKVEEEGPRVSELSKNSRETKARVRNPRFSSHLANRRTVSVSEKVDKDESVAYENRTPTPESENDTRLNRLRSSDNETQVTPSKVKRRNHEAAPGSHRKRRLSKQSLDAKTATVPPRKVPLGMVRDNGTQNEDHNVSKEQSKVLANSQRTAKERRKGSKKLDEDGEIAVTTSAFQHDEQVSESGAIAQRKSRRISSSRKQTQNFDITPESTPSKRRGRPPKSVSYMTKRSHQSGDPQGNEITSIQIRSPERNGVEEETSPRAKIDVTPIISISKSSKSQQKRVQSDKVHLKPSLQAISDPDIEQSLEIAGSELRALMAEDTADGLMKLKTLVLEGLTGKRRCKLIHLEQEYQKVHQLLEQTVLAGEGNSMLLIGSRGTGKTTLVETAISDLAFSHQDQFHVVRLNGFIQTDDKLALREIWRQLGREMEVDDEVMTGQRSNYADTLTSLLALLSHSAEATDPELQNHTAKSVIFIIDEFDLFASHPRQTLLYNLFDVAQSRNAPIAVLGLTTKIDVVESLEKRVKSRFGQRSVYLSAPRTFATFQAICKSALVPQITTPASGSTFTQRLLTQTTAPNIEPLLSAWSTYINALFTQDAIFQSFLWRIYTLTKSIPAFQTASLLPISLLSPTAPLPNGTTFASASSSFGPPDSKLHLLRGLSDLELSLLISAARLDIVLDSDLCTFGMAYDEYVSLATRAKRSSSAAGQFATGAGARVWGIKVAKAAWERLVLLELVVPAVGGNASTGAGTGAGVGGTKGEASRMWRVDVALEEIAPSVEDLGSVMGRWCKEI